MDDFSMDDPVNNMSGGGGGAREKSSDGGGGGGGGGSGGCGDGGGGSGGGGVSGGIDWGQDEDNVTFEALRLFREGAEYTDSDDKYAYEAAEEMMPPGPEPLVYSGNAAIGTSDIHALIAEVTNAGFFTKFTDHLCASIIMHPRILMSGLESFNSHKGSTTCF